MLRTDAIDGFSAKCGLKMPDKVTAVGEFSVFFGGRALQMTVKNIMSSEQAVVKPSMEAKGTIRRLKSPRTTQFFKIEQRDGIVVTGTIPLEQIYNFISDDIRTHTHICE